MHDEATIAGFRSRLEEALKRLHVAVEGELIAEDPQRYAEVLDVMREGGEVRAAERLHELNLASIRRHVVEMHELEAALERMANGHYGVCTHCGTDIPVARLEAQPAAARCVTCQAQQESSAAGA